MSRLAVIAAVVLVPAAAATQDVPTVHLTRPEATSADGFSALIGLRLLSDGRVMVADALEQTIAIVNLRSGDVTTIGRQGSGPGEYGMPGRLFAGAGDTTYMMDMGNRRLLVITPDGKVLSETIPLRNPAGELIPMIPGGMDARGRVYFDLAGIAMPGLEENMRQGRSPLMRWDRERDRIDTIGYVHFPPSQTRAQPGQVRFQMGGGAYEARDAWAVTPDGRVGVARASDYHVEWLGAGAPVAGPAVPYRPIPITDAEKNRWADNMAQRGIAVSIDNGRRSTTRASRPDIHAMEWPAAMPPFPARGALATAGGELWVEQSRSARARERAYDVFDTRGRRVRQVVIANGGAVRWVRGSDVYVVREDEDGLQWIERYALRG